MRIGFLGQCSEKNITGVNRHMVATIQEMLKCNVDNRYYFIGNEKWLPVDLEEIDILFDSNSEICLDYMLQAHKLDIVHSFYRPFRLSDRKCGKILSINDLRPCLGKDWDDKRMINYFNGPLKSAAQNADVVIAISEHTKKDIINFYNIPEEKIKVIYCGLYPSNILSIEGLAVRNDEIIPNNYILSVSAINLNKNTQGLIEAFIRFKEQNEGCPLKLVLTGPVRNSEKVKELLSKKSKAIQDIVFTGYVSDEQLVWLYRNAYAFAYVSFYEGFGLPVLEAMSFGRAVISSNTTSLPEVGGDAVEYCNPYDVDSIVTAIENVVLNEDRKKELECKALAQAAKFSYEKVAGELLEIYRQFK